jgi:hypothetical protein
MIKQIQQVWEDQLDCLWNLSLSDLACAPKHDRFDSDKNKKIGNQSNRPAPWQACSFFSPQHDLEVRL